ncbi:MAG: transglycosylase SLT domain-containing protein [Telluria sp.]
MNRFNAVGAKLTQPASQPSKEFDIAKSARGFLTALQHTLTIVGISALLVMAALWIRPELAKDVSHFLNPEAAAPAIQPPSLADLMDSAKDGAAAEEESTPVSAEEKALLGSKKQQQFVTSWLSRRYRVAGDAANMLVSTAYLTAHEIKLDPLLILAVMSIESGLNPFAESPMGAQGLMQVMSKVHHDKFDELGGVQAALNPVANIRVGAQILKDYVTRGGSVEAGLKTYVGAAAFENDSGYGSKVLSEYHKLQQVAKGKNVPTTNPPAPVAPPPQQVVKEPAKADGTQLAAN